jgi:para-nitrobenzyl esterase
MLLVTLAFVTGCTATRQDTTQAGAMDLQQPGARSVLAGTAWQLVEIVSMDDHVYAPEDRSLYTLVPNADGSMRLRADCNLGTGTWTSESAGQLQFGQIAATQALCAPDSLHDRYMAEFQWVRSYFMKDGRLFLATMADGSIIEFESIHGK